MESDELLEMCLAEIDDYENRVCERHIQMNKLDMELNSALHRQVKLDQALQEIDEMIEQRKNRRKSLIRMIKYYIRKTYDRPNDLAALRCEATRLVKLNNENMCELRKARDELKVARI